MTSDETENINVKGEQFRLRKNVCLLGFGFLLLFTSYISLSRLQSSINSEHGVGNYSSFATYVAVIIGSLFLPTLAISKLTAKWTIVVSMCGYVFYCVAQFYPHFWTLIPTAAIVGICASTLWSAKSVYITQIGHKLAKITAKDNSDTVISSSFSMFFAFFQSNVVLGNVIISLVLGIGTVKEEKTQEEFDKCGANFCPDQILSNSTDEDDDVDYDLKLRVNILTGILLGCALAAIAFVAFFMDALDISDRTDIDKDASTMTLLSSTLRQMKNPNQILLILITIYAGLGLGFLGADYTLAYITCSIGVESIGWIFISGGVANVAMSYSQSWILKYTGRIPLFMFAYILNIAVMITLLLWMPGPYTPIIFYIISIMWGLCEAIYECQINAMHGILFPSNEEAAFANLRLWISLGLALAYLASNLLCIRPKLYILIGISSLGTICYCIVEYRIGTSKKLNRSKKVSK